MKLAEYNKKQIGKNNNLIISNDYISNSHCLNRIAFDNWYPEDIYFQLVKAIKREV